MNTEQNTNTPVKRPTIKELWQDVKSHRKLYYKVLPITFVVVAFLTLSIPNYYNCKVTLAPELSGNRSSSSSLAALASNFGVNLGSRQSADALFPTLYPDLMNSVAFRTSLFPIKVRRANDSTGVTEMTYYEYLKKHQKAPWWAKAKKAVFSVLMYPFKGKKKASTGGEEVNTFKLTQDQAGIVKALAQKVVCDVDKKTMVITINVTDQDPLICAVVADSVQARLQEFITDYRTKKARVDLEYNKKLCAETKARYEKARQLYAEFMDANQDVILQTVRQKQTDLENEMQLQYNAYQQVAAQLLAAEAKVQEEIPAFTTLQSATVPVQKSGPKRAQMCLIFTFLAFIATTVWILYNEDDLKPLLGMG